MASEEKLQMEGDVKMQVNAMTEEFEHIELFGKPVLFTNARVDKATVPEGWYRYDIRGSDYDPGSFGTLEREVAVNHAGTILSPEKIPFPKGRDYIPIRGSQNFLGEELTLAAFCACHGLSIPGNPQKYPVRPASPEEAGLFYAQTPERDEALGTIGQVRMDFGHGGREFWHTWHPRGAQELNSPAFKAELGEVAGQLRESILRDLASMRSYCYDHGGEIEGGTCTQNYGYVVETERYRYLLRCNPIEGDYQADLACFDKQAQKQLIFWARRTPRRRRSWRRRWRSCTGSMSRKPRANTSRAKARRRRPRGHARSVRQSPRAGTRKQAIRRSCRKRRGRRMWQVGSREIVLWLDERWYNALSRHLKDETVEERLDAYLDELIGQLPSSEHGRVSREIREENERMCEQREAERKFAVFSVTQDGKTEHFETTRPFEFLDTANVLRSYLRSQPGRCSTI